MHRGSEGGGCGPGKRRRRRWAPLGRVREREQRRGRSEGELRESERGRGERGGECVAPSGASSGEQVSRRWPELFGRAPRLASAYWQRKKKMMAPALQGFR